MLRYLIRVVLCIFVASSASAETLNNGALRGLKSIDLFIEGVDDEARRCGITETIIRDAFLYPISQSKLQFLPHLGGPTFHVLVTALIQRNPQQCVSSLVVTVMNYQKVQLDYAEERFAWVKLWGPDVWVLVAGANPLAQQVRNATENSTKKFLTAWSFDNKQ